MEKNIIKEVFGDGTKEMLLPSINCFCRVFVGCDKDEGKKNNADSIQNNDTDYEYIDLDYLNVGRYTATIIENEEYVFFADFDGIHKYSKSDESVALIYKGKEIDNLLYYNGNLFFVVDRKKLCRIDIYGDNYELLFPLDDYYLSQLVDYTIFNDEVYFLNTHCLFSLNINTKEITEYLETSVEMLQVYGENIYYSNHAERTFTIYQYSLNEGIVTVIDGEDVEEPNQNICLDFCIINDDLIYRVKEPDEIRIKNLKDGTQTVYIDEEIYFSSFTFEEGIVCVNYDVEKSTIFTLDEWNASQNVFELYRLDLSKGVTVVNGCIYYNSGYRTIINGDGNLIYDYSISIPKSYNKMKS